MSPPSHRVSLRPEYLPPDQVLTLSMWKMRSSSHTFSKHLSSVSTNTCNTTQLPGYTHCVNTIWRAILQWPPQKNNNNNNVENCINNLPQVHSCAKPCPHMLQPYQIQSWSYENLYKNTISVSSCQHCCDLKIHWRSTKKTKKNASAKFNGVYHAN